MIDPNAYYAVKKELEEAHTRIRELGKKIDPTDCHYREKCEVGSAFETKIQELERKLQVAREALENISRKGDEALGFTHMAEQALTTINREEKARGGIDE